MQFYVFKDNEQVGPFPLLDVRAKLKTGELSYGDLAWREGLVDWAPLSELMGGALPDATAHAVSSSNSTPKGTAPTGLRMATSIVVFVLSFLLLALGAWLVAALVCAIIAAAHAAMGHGSSGTDYVSAGRNACQTYFWILVISAAAFSLVMSSVIAWMMAFSNLFPWCRAR